MKNVLKFKVFNLIKRNGFVELNWSIIKTGKSRSIANPLYF